MTGNALNLANLMAGEQNSRSSTGQVAPMAPSYLYAAPPQPSRASLAQQSARGSADHPQRSDQARSSIPAPWCNR